MLGVRASPPLPLFHINLSLIFYKNIVYFVIRFILIAF
nr:MAG TPA: hypothetical protein [Caudoviricetes sp.]DAN73765.1 MAG TPA: hypothetical protein [Caudoviricetes sp.]DAY43207.1 MAG TPA: hypothetical protein [Caudoviricetes sp.]